MDSFLDVVFLWAGEEFVLPSSISYFYLSHPGVRQPGDGKKWSLQIVDNFSATFSVQHFDNRKQAGKAFSAHMIAAGMPEFLAYEKFNLLVRHGVIVYCKSEALTLRHIDGTLLFSHTGNADLDRRVNMTLDIVAVNKYIVVDRAVPIAAAYNSPNQLGKFDSYHLLFSIGKQ